MRNSLLKVAFIAIALLTGAAYASAQRISDREIEFRGGHLRDADGNILRDFEVQDLVGREIYRQTYVGACKQYKAGKGLIIGGSAAIVSGIAASVISASVIGPDAFNAIHSRDVDQVNTYLKNNKDKAIGIAGFFGGIALASIGGICLDAGIPLAIIGKSRLNWVAEDYNEKVYRRSQRPGISIGLGENGPGLHLNF